MPHNFKVDLLTELDSISKIHTLKRDGIDDIMVVFSKRIIAALKIERMSVWLFNTDKSLMTSIGEYDKQNESFSKDSILTYSQFKKYIDLLFTNEIIIAPNVFQNERLNQLNEPYFRPNNVISLMDIPLRMEGEIIGVMCFEKTGNLEHQFSAQDQFFALSISTVFSSLLESRKRRVIQHELDKEIAQKELLLKEMKHRIKNNLSVVSSLVRLQSERALDDYHRELLLDCNNRIESVSTMYDLIYNTENVQTVNFNEYISTLISKINSAFNIETRNIVIKHDIPNIDVKIDLAVNLSLIINEVITNSYKHAFQNISKPVINLKVLMNSNSMVIDIDDNGIGFANMKVRDSFGMGIIEGLAEQINAEYFYRGENGSHFWLKLDL